MTMFLRDATGAEALYQVHDDGTLGFGGGWRARLGSVTWTGPLTTDEITQLRDLLAQHHWFRPPPTATGQPPDQMYRVDIHSPEGRSQFRIKGEHPDLQPIQALLARAALRRLESDLERLPKPSSQRPPGPTTRP